MKATEHHAAGGENPTVDHEASDINVRAILIVAVSLAASAVVISAVVWLQFRYYQSTADRSDPPPAPLAVKPGTLPPEPRLQGLPWDPSKGWLTPTQDLDVFRRAEEERLHAYGWVDEAAGVVHIPIERAIEIMVEKGGGLGATSQVPGTPGSAAMPREGATQKGSHAPPH